MQEASREAVTHSDGCIETRAALWLLASLASFYRLPFDADLVTKRFAPPFDLPTLIEALEALGLKAGLASWPQDDWQSLPLPAVVFLSGCDTQDASVSTDSLAVVTGTLAPTTLHSLCTPALIVKHGDRTLAWVQPGQTHPETLSADAARAQCRPLMLLVAEAEPPLTESSSKAPVKKAHKKKKRKKKEEATKTK